MSPIPGLRFMGSRRGKAADLKDNVAASEEQRESQISEPSQKAEFYGKARPVERKPPPLLKEACSHQRTRSSSSKDNGAATSKESTRKKSEIHDETRSSLPGQISALSMKTDSHRIKKTSGKQTGAVRSDEGNLKDPEVLGEPSSIRRKKPSSTKATSSNQRTKKRSSKGIPDEKTWLADGGSSSNSTIVTRKNFQNLKSPRADEIFTNHESLPSLSTAYKQFTKTYPEYLHTVVVDQIRAEEYPHLEENGHVCLDYSGYGLFSQAQQEWDKASSSFGLSYISANLPTLAIYGGADDGTSEFDIKCRICNFLNVQESEYGMVFTASRGSAFKLLAESYPFHLKKRLLTVYDSESDAVNWLEETARKKGADVLCATFRWPSQRLWATDLQKKIQEKKKKKESGKGLFVFPMQSRVTGTKYSYQWMSQAQENEWDVLLDASALEARVMGSLGLSVFRPEFIVSSFFKVYGSDPTGFGCLLIKRCSIPGLHNSSAARGVGMVRIVPLTAESSSARFSEACVRDTPLDKEIEIVDQKEDKIHSGAWAIQAGQREAAPILASSDPKIHFFEAESSNKLSTLPLGAFKSQRGRETEVGSNSPGIGTGSPVFDEQKTEVELGLSGGNPISLIPTHMASSSELQQEQIDVLHLIGIIKNSASDDCEIHGAASDGERGASDSETDYSLVRTIDPQQGNTNNRNIVADGRASWGSLSQEETNGGSHRSSGQGISASAYYMDSQGDHSFLYSEDALSVIPDEEEDFDDDASIVSDVANDVTAIVRKEPEIICRGLDHADMLGLSKTNTRLRCLINWLVGSMVQLHHPGSQGSYCLIQIYGPEICYDRGSSVAFNLFDWRGSLLQPTLVQRLADRSNISLETTTLHHIRFPDNYLGFLEPSRGNNVWTPTVNGQLEGGGKFPSIEVITATLSFMTNFEDVYRFWAFLAKFLDADFVSKELWRYRSLNQETVLLGLHDFISSPLRGMFNP